MRTNLTVLDKTHGTVHIFNNVVEGEGVRQILDTFTGNQIEYMTARSDYFRVSIETVN